MSAFSPLQVVLAIWAVVAIIYVLLLVYRSVVGLKEEDTIYLSAGESRMAEEQREIMKRINKVEPLVKVFGYATLAMSIVAAAAWGYNVYRQLL